MPLTLHPALPQDAPRIAQIHMLAFSPNAMLRAQFPTPAVRIALQLAIEKKALADILDPKISVLVVRESTDEDGDVEQVDNRTEGGEGKIISFAKWSHPVREREEYEEVPWEWPPGTDHDVLEGWTGIIEKARERVVGRGPCYSLSFIGTDPAHERRGAATLLIEWGKEQCRREKVLAYLESTMEAAPLYERLGFSAEEVLEMRLRQSGEDGEEKGEKGGKVYREVGFLYRP